MVYPLVPVRKSQEYPSRLYVDKNVDQKSDEIRESSAGAGNSLASAVRYYPIVKNGGQRGKAVESLVRIEWEDQAKPPDGDFNDYVGAIAMKDCDKTKFPPGLVNWSGEGLSCEDGCFQGPCATTALSRPDDLRIHAAVGVDSSSSEHFREARGRMITLSLAIYGDPIVSQQYIAVCPTMWFKYYNTNKATKWDWDCSRSFAPDPIQIHDIGSGGSCSFNGTSDIACVDVRQACDEFPVSLAREQLYGSGACKVPMTGRQDPGDAFVLPPGTTCGASATMLDFQIQELRVDSSLTDPAWGLASRRSVDIIENREQWVDRVELLVVDQLKSPNDFHCPSGVNVQNIAIDPSVGRARKITFANPQTTSAQSFDVYTRQ
jgi:hypothetical protein